VTATVPGVKPAQLVVELDEANVLHIRYHTQERSRDDSDVDKWIIHKKERFETSAWRNFVLPSDIECVAMAPRSTAASTRRRLTPPQHATRSPASPAARRRSAPGWSTASCT
jgi:hypothetical protein